MEKKPLPPDEPSAKRLRDKLASLSLPPQAGRETSPIADFVSGRNYLLPANEDKLEAVTLQTGTAGTTLALRWGGRESRVACGFLEWRPGGTLPAGGSEQRVAGTGAWSADDTYSAKLCAYETPYCLTARLRFSGDEVVLDREWNVAFGNQWKRPQLVGRAEATAQRH
jgi:hypothetical protein